MRSAVIKMSQYQVFKQMSFLMICFDKPQPHSLQYTLSSCQVTMVGRAVPSFYVSTHPKLSIIVIFLKNEGGPKFLCVLYLGNLALFLSVPDVLYQTSINECSNN